MARVTARRPTVQRIDDPDEEGPDVRLAEQRDVPRIAATLTVALADSRWTRWALPDDGRMQRLTRLHELDAGAPGRLHAAAPGSPTTSPPSPSGSRRRRAGTAPLPADVRAALARELPYLAARPLAAVRDTAALVDGRPARTSRTGGWPTSASGRRPGGRGLAAAVLAPVLVRCDAEGTLAAAAVFSWANVRFLRGFGFEVTARAADGGRRAAAVGAGAAASAPAEISSGDLSIRGAPVRTEGERPARGRRRPEEDEMPQYLLDRRPARRRACRRPRSWTRS